MKSVIRHKDGRRFNLAGGLSVEEYAELEGTRSTRRDPALWCGGCDGLIYVRHGSVRKDELFGTHYDAGACPETLRIRKSAMSDEHKRQAEYTALAAQRAGFGADLEVATTGHTRVDVVIDGRVGIEVQRSALKKASAVDRTARSMAAGLEMVAWFTDRAASPQWYGHVPGYKTTAAAAAWQSLPLPGTVTAAGLRVIEAVRCGTRTPCPHRQRPCSRWIPWPEPWIGLHVDDVVAGLAEGAIRPMVMSCGEVRLLSNRSIAIYAGLGPAHLDPYSAGQPKSRPLPPSDEQECDRPPPVAPVPAEPPFWCETCGRTHPIREHRHCRETAA